MNSSLFCGASCLALFLTAFTPSHAAESVWVRPGVTGRLIYTPDAEGDRILDFSAVGYQGKGVEAIPASVNTAVTVAPISGDDTASIQAAINAVSSLPLGPDGYRGAVQLTAGHFDIGGHLEIRASGVVLRGLGQAETGTVLHGRSSGPAGTNQRALIQVYGSGGLSNVGSRRNLVDKVVPVGATSFRVDNAGTFQPGDAVRVIRNTNDDWISDIGMDSIPPRSDGGDVTQWTSTTINQRFDRVVTRIEGDRVFIDAPLPNAIEQQYGGGTIQKYSWNGAIENVGIENLRGESDFSSNTDEDHAWEFVSIGVSHVSSRAQNVWVRDIHGKYFGDSLVVANPGSKWVTVQGTVNEDPKSIVTGGRRYTYDLSGELGLVTEAHADKGRHDFVNNSTSPRGPNVFHNSTSTNANEDSGPHQRWATGTLFDNVTVQGDAINIRNRSNLGSGHGWAGANMTVWNSTAASFIIQNPPTAQNWLVGSTGAIIEDTQFGPQPAGYYDSPNQPVTLGDQTSLYDAQRDDARDIDYFEWSEGVGSWEDHMGWRNGVVPGLYEVMSRDYLLGDIDNYTDDGTGSVDNAFIDAGWKSAVESSSALPVVGFDKSGGPASVGFTIQHQLDGGERVIHGSLALAVRQTGGVIDSDFLRLFDQNPANQASFADLGWAQQIKSMESFVGVVDLGGSLGDLQGGTINVQLSQDVAVDWAMYVATVATPIGGAEFASVAITGGETAVTSDLGVVGSLQVGDETDGVLRLGQGGRLQVLGPYEQSTGGKLLIEVSAVSAGQLVMSGVASLSGDLELTLAPGYSPLGGESWALITTEQGAVGSFDDLFLPSIDEGLRWIVTQSSAGVVASVALAGDYNLNGSIDAADYTVWRDSYGSEVLLMADGDGNGVVDDGDYAVWRNGYGRSIAPATHAVPEFATISGVGFAALLIAVYRSRYEAASPR